jgi:hypothetical protein
MRNDGKIDFIARMLILGTLLIQPRYLEQDGEQHSQAWSYRTTTYWVAHTMAQMYPGVPKPYTGK